MQRTSNKNFRIKDSFPLTLASLWTLRYTELKNIVLPFTDFPINIISERAYQNWGIITIHV